MRTDVQVSAQRLALLGTMAAAAWALSQLLKRPFRNRQLAFAAGPTPKASSSACAVPEEAVSATQSAPRTPEVPLHGSFGGRPLSRETGARHKDPAWLATALLDAKFLFFIVAGRKAIAPLLQVDGQGKAAVVSIPWQKARLCADLGLDLNKVQSGEIGPVLLGERDGTQHFAILVADLPEERLKACEVADGAELLVASDLRSLLMSTSQSDLAIVGQALAKLRWHQTALFCGSCGAKTDSIEAGLKRACKACHARHYPRTNPTCIMLVRHPTDPKKVLLGRGKQMQPGMYSCLAGFLEISESVEEAIAREVMEEAGLTVDISKGVDLLGTQPWPISRMPSCDLMIAAEVTATTDKIVVNTDEMDDVSWFDHSQVMEMLSTPVGTPGKLSVPSEVAIANHLLQRWADRVTSRL